MHGEGGWIRDARLPQGYREFTDYKFLSGSPARVKRGFEDWNAPAGLGAMTVPPVEECRGQHRLILAGARCDAMFSTCAAFPHHPLHQRLSDTRISRTTANRCRRVETWRARTMTPVFSSSSAGPRGTERSLRCLRGVQCARRAADQHRSGCGAEPRHSRDNSTASCRYAGVIAGSRLDFLAADSV